MVPHLPKHALIGLVLAAPAGQAAAMHADTHVPAQHPSSRIVMHDTSDMMVRDVMIRELYVRDLMPRERPGRIGAEGGYADVSPFFDPPAGLGLNNITQL